MTMPTKAKTWIPHSLNNRITYVSVLDVHQQQLHQLKEFIKGVAGVTVKGSGDNAAAAMDGTDRIASSSEWVRGNGIAAVHSWIVYVCGNMGVELLLDYAGASDEQMRLCYSVAGYAVNGTNARFSPTAADEVVICGSSTNGSPWGSSVTSGDRIWSAYKASDGKALYFIAARAGAWSSFVMVEEIASAVVAPATYTPSVVGCVMASAPAITSWVSGVLWKTRVNGFSLGAALGCAVSMEGSQGSTMPQLFTSVLELQASQWPVMALGLWSMAQVGARGKLGNLVDVWAGNVAAADGDTYPNDTSRQFIAFGDFVLIWNGTPTVDGTTPVMS